MRPRPKPGQQPDADVCLLAGSTFYAGLSECCDSGKACDATTDARQPAAYVVTDAPAPGGAAGWSGTKQGTPWGALFWFFRCRESGLLHE